MTTLSRLLIAPLLSMALMTTASAQEQPSPYSCKGQPGFDGFDFWLGEWDVRESTTGTLAGTNRIVKEEAGCIVMEYWTSTQGVTGRSMNIYNPLDDSWTQTWMSANGTLIVLTGKATPQGMEMEGPITYYGLGVSTTLRGTWTHSEDGSVRQSFEQLNPETNKWEPWFNGTYRKRQMGAR